MKRIFKWMTGALLIGLVLISLPVEKVLAQGGAPVSFQTFYDDLSPYGQWIDDPDYGYVWAPDVDQDFRPYYSGGHWVMTEYGNTWVSDYDWGWAPFHYGRWAQSNSYGWIWVPGTEWGPAWVSWRSGGGNYGWAPMAPGISVSLSFGSGYYVPNDWWVFIPQQYIYSNNYYNYWRGPRYNSGYYNNTTYINNTYVYNHNTYVCGPGRREVERVTGGRVNVYTIRNENRPGKTQLRSNAVSIYRPTVNRAPRTNQQIAPRNVVRAERTVIDRNPGNVRNNGSIRRNEMNGGAPVRQNRNELRPDRQPNERIAPQRNPDRNGLQRERQTMDRMPAQEINRGQNIERRQNNDRQQSGIDRPQREWRRPEPQQIDRQQQPGRMPQRMERQQQPDRMQPQRMERQPQRMEAPRQMDRPQRMERPQPQRVERPQPQMRMERPQPQREERSQPQRIERSAPSQDRGHQDRGGRR